MLQAGACASRLGGAVPAVGVSMLAPWNRGRAVTLHLAGPLGWVAWPAIGGVVRACLIGALGVDRPGCWLSRRVAGV